MEQILGGRIGYDGTIPGTKAVSGMEFVYLGHNEKRFPREQFEDLMQHLNPPYPKSGGASNYGCQLTLPDGTVFHAVEYHGDLEGWRKQIELGVQRAGLPLARIVEGRLVISDGRAVPLGQCEATFK
jgi:hypothetical protein